MVNEYVTESWDEDLRYLVRFSVESGPGIDTGAEIVRIVLFPVAVEDVDEAATEGFVFPSFDRASWKQIPQSILGMTIHINKYRTSIPST